MARRAYTKELYDRLVRGYREAPNNSSHAARIAGCDRKTAKRAYDLGWPKRAWAPPIKEYLEKEKEMIRAQRHAALLEDRKKEEEMRDKAREDSLNAQKQEAAGSAAARANALAVANMIGRIVMGCIPLSQVISDRLKEGTYNEMTPNQAMKLFSSAAYVVRQGNEAIKLALEIERLRVGEPTSIMALRADEMSIDDVATNLSHLHRTLQRAVDRGMPFDQAEAQYDEERSIEEELEDDEEDGQEVEVH